MKTPTPKPAAPTAKPAVDAAAPATALPPTDAPRRPEPQPRKGPGRPRREGPAAEETATRTSGADGANTREAPKARKADTKEGQKRAAERLVIWHRALAKFTGVPFLEMDLTDASLLVESWGDVTEEFGIEIGGKWAVLLAFVGTASGIYLPKVLLTLHAIEQMRAAAGMGGQPQGHDGPRGPAPTINPDGSPA